MAHECKEVSGIPEDVKIEAGRLFARVIVQTYESDGNLFSRTCQEYANIKKSDFHMLESAVNKTLNDAGDAKHGKQ